MRSLSRTWGSDVGGRESQTWGWQSYGDDGDRGRVTGEDF